MKISELAELTNVSAKTTAPTRTRGFLSPAARSASRYRDYERWC
ncbi:hypothetical protein L838_0453 [Mycobacterium avium MAV_120709_2344]|nr:hypothetical protein L838_0453 [Mycobacterium avium MAV_120709_2344]